MPRGTWRWTPTIVQSEQHFRALKQEKRNLAIWGAGDALAERFTHVVLIWDVSACEPLCPQMILPDVNQPTAGLEQKYLHGQKGTHCKNSDKKLPIAQLTPQQCHSSHYLINREKKISNNIYYSKKENPCSISLFSGVVLPLQWGHQEKYGVVTIEWPPPPGPGCQVSSKPVVFY